MIEKLADLLTGNKSGTQETTDPGEGKGPSNTPCLYFVFKGSRFYGYLKIEYL